MAYWRDRFQIFDPEVKAEFPEVDWEEVYKAIHARLEKLIPIIAYDSLQRDLPKMVADFEEVVDALHTVAYAGGWQDEDEGDDALHELYDFGDQYRYWFE